MVLGYSLAIYVEFVHPADVAPFMWCHVNGFEYFGGVPRRCLHHNAKVVVERDESRRPNWNSRMPNFASRVCFELSMCRPYRAHTKGKVEIRVKYVRHNLLPSVRFNDVNADLDRLLKKPWLSLGRVERKMG